MRQRVVLMDNKYVAGLLVTAAVVGASAAIARWPFNYTAELVLCASIFSAIGIVGWWTEGYLWGRFNPSLKIISVFMCGVIAGSYIAVFAVYFAGYLADTYPVSQKIIADQQRSIKALTNDLSTLQKSYDSAVASLRDAQKVLSDPLSVPKPAYNLPTSLRLQFNGRGDAKEVNSLKYLLE